MKTLILSIFVLSFGVFAASTPSKAEMEGLVKACMTEFKVKGSLLIEAYSDSLQPEDVPENLKCAMKCYVEKLELYDSGTGEFLFDKAKEQFGDAVDGCEDTKGTDDCDTAYQFVKCFWKKNQ